MESAGELSGGGVIKLNGPASLPVAVAIAHGGKYAAGDLID